MIRQAVVLCNGKGMVAGLPRVLMPMGKKPFVWYLAKTLEAAGIEDIVLMIDSENESLVPQGFAMGSPYNGPLRDIKPLRTAESDGDVDEDILAIPGLEERFVLADGGCYPIMRLCEWEELLKLTVGRLLVNPLGMDVGAAVVKCEDIGDVVSCASMSKMPYIHFHALGALHIDDDDGLEDALRYLRMFGFLS